MKKVGELLKAERIKKKLSLDDVSIDTKIQKKYLKAIEESNYNQLPAVTFVKGFIQNYAKAIKLNPKTMLAIFRRDFSQDASGQIVPRSFSKPIQKKISISPKTTTSIIVAITALLITALFTRQIILFYKGPEISIKTPGEEQTLTSPFEVSGTASIEASVLVNNQTTIINQSGEFTTQLQLDPGVHIITVTAKDRNGKTTTIQRQVNISP